MSDETKNDASSDSASVAEKAFLLGLGVLQLTREKTSELASDLIEKGRVSHGDAKEMADKIGTFAKESQENLRKTVASETEKAIRATGGVTRRDLEELREEIAELRKLIESSSSGSKGKGKRA